MNHTAVVVCDEFEEQERRLTQLLDFFGVEWEKFGPDTLWTPPAALQEGSYCVFCSMRLLGRAVETRRDVTGLPYLLSRSRSVYLFGGSDSAAACHVVRWLTHCASADLVPTQGEEIVCSEVPTLAEVCGPMSGLHVGAASMNAGLAMHIPQPGGDFNALISSNESHHFVRVVFDRVPCFLDSCAELIDISGPVQKGFFDVRDYFLSAVPIVMYLRSEFGAGLPSAAENGACLIVDDPVLRPQYGFVNFQRISTVTREHGFTCTTAFIPWNCERSHSSVIELFKRHSDRLSLCIHGCDHTAGEFGTTSTETLNARIKLAIRRMERHRQSTELPHEALMVFPQGIFSPEALAVLKHNSFIAAVNTDVSPANQPSRTTIGEVWKMAIMQYADFALYTRRYPFHGVCNFAFDILLGKPVLITTHSEDFHDNCEELLHFVKQLKALKTTLMWRTLQEVIRRAYRRRLRSDGVFHVTMFANEIRLDNPDKLSRRFIVEKPERNPDGVDHFESNDRRIEFVHNQDHLRFELDIPAQQNALIRLRYKDVYGDAQFNRAAIGELKLMARRYLSEFRDEAQARAPWLLACASKARSWLQMPHS